MLAVGDLIDKVRARAQLLDREGQFERRSDGRYLEAAGEMALAQPGIDQRRLPARVRPDEQAGIGLLDAGDRGIEDVAGTARRVEPGAILPAIEIGRAERRHQL